MHDLFKRTLVVGVFDLFHRGHVELLKYAKGRSEFVLVVVNGDDFTASYKRRPVVGEADRLAIVEACRYVDEARISLQADVKPFVEEYAIECIVHGDDWEHESYLRQICLTRAYIEVRGITFLYPKYYTQGSTTQLIEQILRQGL